MKKRISSRMSVRTKSSVKRYVLAGISLSLVIAFAFVGVFYFGNEEESVAGGNPFSKGPKKGKRAGIFVKSRSVECKPNSGYKKGKVSKSDFRGRANRTPYTYVYKSPSAAPPRAQEVAAKSRMVESFESEELVASLKPTISIKTKAPEETVASPNSILKSMSPEERKLAVLNMKPTKQLPPIRFISDQDEFSVANMDSFMEALEMVNQGKMVLVEGHTDDLGSSEYNLNLSIKRVEKIRQLMLQAGADDRLISLVGYGEEKPLVPNTNNQNREINRRIEFKIFDL